MKLTWFAANVVVVALTFQFLVQSVTLSGLASTFWKCTVCAFERNDPSSSKCALCKEENVEFVLPRTCEPSNAGLAPTSWKCTVCAFERNDPSSSKCALCKEENVEFVLPRTCEPSNAGLAPTSWKCTVCAFERNDPSSSKCAFCKEENAAFVLPHTCEPSNAGSGDYTDDIISTEKDKTDGSTTGDDIVTINLVDGKKGSDDYTDDIISTEKDKTDGSTTGDDIVTINLVDGKKGSDDYTDDIISTEKDKTDGSTTGDDAVTINLVTDKEDELATNLQVTPVEGTNEGSRESTATLFFCFVLFICLAILGGVQFAIFKHHRTVYQGFEDAHLIEDNDNPETIIEVEEEEGHRLPPDSRDYATEVCRSVCLGAVCCAAWIIVPYYHCKERRQRRRENNLTRSQELLRKLYW
eukprot:273204_1